MQRKQFQQCVLVYSLSSNLTTGLSIAMTSPAEMSLFAIVNLPWCSVDSIVTLSANLKMNLCYRISRILLKNSEYFRIK